MKKERPSFTASLTQAANHELISHLGTITSQCERFLLGLEEGLYKNKSDKEIIEKAAEIMRINLGAISSAKEIIQGVSNYIHSIREAFIEDIDIRKSIDKALALLEYKMKNTNINIKKKFPAKLSMIKASPSEIQEVFLIVIDNAIEAIKEKGRGTISIKVTEKKSTISAEIKDTGCGIAQETIKRIFDPFFSAKPHNSRKGLGLFIANEIMCNSSALEVKTLLSL